MSPKNMADPDYKFPGPANQHHQKMKEDTRRHQIQIAEAKKTPSWKVTQKDQGPLWEFHRGKDGKTTLAKQLRPQPDSMDEMSQHRGKRFVCVTSGMPCLIGGEHVEAGARVECFADCAFTLHGDRGQIIEEVTP